MALDAQEMALLGLQAFLHKALHTESDEQTSDLGLIGVAGQPFAQKSGQLLAKTLRRWYSLHGVSVPFPPRCYGIVRIVVHSTGYRIAAHSYRDYRPLPRLPNHQSRDDPLARSSLGSTGLEQLPINVFLLGFGLTTSMQVHTGVIPRLVGGNVGTTSAVDGPLASASLRSVAHPRDRKTRQKTHFAPDLRKLG